MESALTIHILIMEPQGVSYGHVYMPIKISMYDSLLTCTDSIQVVNSPHTHVDTHTPFVN